MMGWDTSKDERASSKDRGVIVKKMEGSFKAIIAINGKPSVLEKVYVESRERVTGLPRVLYVDLFGRTWETGSPIACPS